VSVATALRTRLFREHARIGGRHGIPKPWVLAFDRRGFDLIVRITLFGFAIDWAGGVGHAFAQALRDHIDWKERAPALFLPTAAVDRLDVKEASSVLAPRPRSSVILEFVTPLDAAGDDPLDRPASVIGRLARRIDLLARWMDIEIEDDWRELAALWNDLNYDVASLSRARLDSRSGRDHRRFQRGLVQGGLAIAGDLARSSPSADSLTPAAAPPRGWGGIGWGEPEGLAEGDGFRRDQHAAAPRRRTRTVSVGVSFVFWQHSRRPLASRPVAAPRVFRPTNSRTGIHTRLCENLRNSASEILVENVGSRFVSLRQSICAKHSLLRWRRAKIPNKHGLSRANLCTATPQPRPKIRSLPPFFSKPFRGLGTEFVSS
jgi:hypothetical protein